MKKFGYTKQEKLKQDKEISLLFEKGKWKSVGNIRMKIYQIPEEQSVAKIFHQPKVSVSVSKKLFKKAVHRNRIKRLLREVYRLNKTIFIEKFGNSTLAMLFWSSKKLPQHYKEVEQDFLNLCKMRDSK